VRTTPQLGGALGPVSCLQQRDGEVNQRAGLIAGDGSIVLVVVQLKGE
jgi:hypothetical protein